MRHFYFLSALLLISTCGGGGGGGGSAPVAPTPNISVTLSASADSAEVNSSITLTWSSTLATSCSASGSWSGSKGTSGSESITIGVVGSNTFSLSCLATGANSGSASTTVNGLRYFDGKVFDGYIRGAEVFVDTNDNLTLDANEASVSTDNAGSFSKLLFGNGILVAKGGIDLDTGADLSKLTLVHKLDGYETSKLASPFTTMIAYMSDASTINAALGIDASIDLLTTDPIPNLGDGIYDQMYEKGNQLTVLSYTLQNHSDAVDGTSELYFQAIADQLEESYAANQAAVDIEDSTFISKVIDKVETAKDVTFSSDVKANLNTVLSSTIPLLKVYADASTTASVQRFAFSTLQNDVKDSTVMIGNASATLLKYENNVFEYVASDQGIDEAAINPINNIAPTISSAATFSAAENQTSIGSVTATDADADTLTYSISGSEINISSSGVLTFASAPDYETKTSYTATVTVSDGTDSVTQAITVSITDVDETVPNEAPTISSSATFSAAENQTSIGSVSASDPDGDSLTYSISGSEINISSSGVLTFASAPDYETKTSYTATVTVSDGTDSVTQAITVSITDVDETVPNEAPTISSSATFSAAENQTSIGSVSASDPDGDSLTYSISGSEINISSSGVLTFASAPDYETKTSYTATVTVSDGTDSVTQAITVSITDVDETVPNEAPTISSSATFSAAENQTSIGSVSASDPDGDSLTYSISGSEINISSSGVLTFASAPDYETKTSYTATVTVSDGTASVTQTITVNVTNLNDNNPTITSSATFSAAENQTSIGSVTATDADGDTLTYSISGSEINISSSGVLTFASAPDRETKDSYTATVTVSDGTNSTTQNITVNVTNLNDNNPTITSSATFSAAENQTSIGSVTATDADGDTLTYSISGSEINISSSGVLTFASAPDRETKDSYTATVTVSDGTNSTTQNITVNISDINEPPVLSLNINQTTLPNLTFAENECTQCAGFTVTDPEGSSSIRLSISGTDAGVMNTDRLNNFSGAIYFPQGFDMEDPQDSDKDNIYNYTFTATEYGNGCGGMLDNADVGTCLSTSQELNVIITNVSEHTPSIRCSPCDFNSGISVAENQTAVANVAGYDRDWGSDLVYSLSGTDAASFNITNASPSFATLATSPVTMNSSDTCYIAYGWDTSQFTCQYGTITFKSAPDYETKSSYSININVTADGDTFTWENVTINVTDVEE